MEKDAKRKKEERKKDAKYAQRKEILEEQLRDERERTVI
jgi:hypothetical protein